MDRTGPSGVDRFGLPLERPALLAETPAEQRAREEAIRRLVSEVFQVVEKHLGKREARRLWADTPPDLKRGSPAKSRDNHRDEFLLALYDHARSIGGYPVDRIPAELGAMLYKAGETPSGWPIQSADAAEKMIRRLVEARLNRLAQTTPTLLTHAGQEFSGN